MSAGDEDLVIFGRYSTTSTPKSTDLSVFRLHVNAASRAARLVALSCSEEVYQETAGGPFESPSYLCLAAPPSSHLLSLLLVSERGSGEGALASVALHVDAQSGAYRLVEKSAAASGGVHPCHVSLSACGGYVFCSNYAADDSAGTLSVHALSPDGLISPHALVRPPAVGSAHPHAAFQAPHVHMALALNETTVLVADLGSNAVHTVAIPSCQIVHTLTRAPTTGPRHLALSKDRDLLLCLNEWAVTIDLLAVHPGDASLSVVSSISACGPSVDTSSAQSAAIRIFDRFVYVSNRGIDSLSVFELQKGSSPAVLVHLQTLSAGGKWPRDFAIHPSGSFLLVANQHSSTVNLFWRDQQTGLLSDAGVATEVSNVASILFSRC
ncbi:MAG: beta-propeller fold lactonase family protein [archaeon]|nr:beta-propeller fold lactonase family protein [archaeon]